MSDTINRRNHSRKKLIFPLRAGKRGNISGADFEFVSDGGITRGDTGEDDFESHPGL